MSNDQITKLFKYVQAEFKAVRGEISDVKKGQSDILNALDSYAKQVLDYHQEMLMVAHKVDRLEKWINQIAQKTDVKLSYE